MQDLLVFKIQFFPVINIIITAFKKEGSKKKIPTYFAANQSNKDQTKQTPACSSKHLALGHQTIDFQTGKKREKKLSICRFSSTLEQSDFFMFLYKLTR